MWRETTLLTDRAVQFGTAKTCVFSDSVLCLGGISTEPVKALETKILHGFWKHVISKIWIESTVNKWNPSGKFPRIYYIANPRRNSKYDDWIRVWTGAIQRKDHIHVNVHWHWLGKTRKQRRLYCECSESYWVCSKFHARTLVVSRAWIGEQMVRNSCQQTCCRKGENCWRHDAQLCRKRTSCIPCYQCIRKRRIEKQRKRSTFHSLQRWWWHHWIDSSNKYFRQSAQRLRSSSGFV